VTEAGALVVDASAVVAMLRSESTGEATRIELIGAVEHADRVVVPTLFWLEMMSSLTRRHRMEAADVLNAIHSVDQSGIETIELDRPLVVMALDLVDRHGLTPYDAAYLAVAESLDARLLTYDEELGEAAGDRAVVIGGETRSREAPARYEHQATWPRYREASAFLAKLRADALAGRG
jgi:predicted nucleic acid-binding protein